MQRVNVIWFRRDLRLEDNQALFDASISGDPVLPIFVIDPWFYSWAEVGKMRVRFMFESLQNLHQNLIGVGNQLLILEGNSEQMLSDLQKLLIQCNFQPHLYFNQDVQTEYGKERDTKVVENWNSNQPKTVHEGQAYFLLQNENAMVNWRQEYYKYQQLNIFSKPANIPFSKDLQTRARELPHLTLVDLKNKYPQFAAHQSELFYGGETTAHTVLTDFLDNRFIGYHWKLSRPYLAQKGSTSQLSPHLMFGTVSPRQVYQKTRQKIAVLKTSKTKNPKSAFSLNAFLDRMRWKDSFTQRFWFHPEYSWKNRFAEFDFLHYHDRILTDQEQEFLELWENGTTGFPLVDASMRQLRTQGWMNFRMRAMCATFFAINCNLPWQLGAQHYMNYLVDGDVCIDAWQWQMQSGITNPLSPTFRIYNPTKNISEKDPDLEYIYHWVPELQGFDMNQILTGDYYGYSSYPRSMLDFTQTRKINGKVVSDLRKQVRTRLLQEQGLELKEAEVAHQVVLKYNEGTQKRYQKIKPQLNSQPLSQPSLFDEGNE